jgi:phospholipid/cholesterol/gamma-HCH transport system ATP-binding protein
MNTPPLLRTQDLQLAPAQLLDGRIDLTLAAGEIGVVQTPTSEAATALARTLLGLESPVGGRIELFGQDLAALTERALLSLRRGATLLHAREGDGLLPAWSAMDNLALAWLQRPQRGSSDRVQMRRELLDQARRYRISPDSLDEPVARRSRGERLALALWRALLGQPALVVVDGPALEPHLFAADFALERLLADTCAHGAALLILGPQPGPIPEVWPTKGPVRRIALGERTVDENSHPSPPLAHDLAA